MTKSLCFDSGPIISLTMSQLLWILKPLKERFGGKFYITPLVKKELVEKPLTIKRFEFEALQVMQLINDGTLEVYTAVPPQRTAQIQQLANSAFTVKKQNLDILHAGEIETVAAAVTLGCPLVIDERTTRLLIENSGQLQKLLGNRLHSEVRSVGENITKFQKSVGPLTIIRSVELVAVAYRLGILNNYIPKVSNGKSTLLDAVLWATKYNGCAVTEKEIDEIKESLLQR